MFSKVIIKKRITQSLALFSSIRGYTLITIILAQYLTARYILAKEKSWVEILTDQSFFLLILATSFSIAGGYLINNFYDAEKDKINRPYKYLLDTSYSPYLQLVLYGFLNFLSLLLSSLVSTRAFLFFTSYIFGMWLYSHALKKTFWISNFFATALAIIPFFAIALYFQRFYYFILFHALFLFLVILIRDLTKDLKNLKGDWIINYRTIPVVFGLKKSKQLISILILLTSIPLYFLTQKSSHLGLMRYYFLFSIPYLLTFLILIWKSNSQKLYLWLHNALKILILLGVFSLILIRYSN